MLAVKGLKRRNNVSSWVMTVQNHSERLFNSYQWQIKIFLLSTFIISSSPWTTDLNSFIKYFYVKWYDDMATIGPLRFPYLNPQVIVEYLRKLLFQSQYQERETFMQTQNIPSQIHEKYLRWNVTKNIWLLIYSCVRGYQSVSSYPDNIPMTDVALHPSQSTFGRLLYVVRVSLRRWIFSHFSTQIIFIVIRQMEEMNQSVMLRTNIFFINHNNAKTEISQEGRRGSAAIWRLKCSNIYIAPLSVEQTNHFTVEYNLEIPPFLPSLFPFPTSDIFLWFSSLEIWMNILWIFYEYFFCFENWNILQQSWSEALIVFYVYFYLERSYVLYYPSFAASIVVSS